MDWQDEIEEFIQLKMNNPSRFLAMKKAARNNAVRGQEWEDVLEDMAGKSVGQEKEKTDRRRLDYRPTVLDRASC